MSDITESTTQHPLKGTYSRAVVNESIQREQHGLGPFEDRANPASAHGAGQPVKHFRLMSLGEFCCFLCNHPR